MKYLFFLGCSLSIAGPALAQDAAAEDGGSKVNILDNSPRDDTITVLANGWREQIDATGQSVSIIGESEIAQVQGPDLSRVLERLPGVTMARSGPLGSQTSLFVRGANSEQVVVLLDGVRMQDVAAPSGGFDFGTLLSSGISKIELLRGSNSLAWGSDAVGGVLAVTSQDLSGARAGVEYGAHDSISSHAALGTLGDSYGITLSGGYTSSDGISAFAGGSEPDAFRQWQVGGRGRVDFSDTVSAHVAARYADSKVGFDGYPAPAYVFADTPEYQITRQGSGYAGLTYRGDGLSLRGGLGLSDTRRAYYDPSVGSAPGFNTVGRSWRADLSGQAQLADGLSLTFGADSEWTRFSTTFDPKKTARQSGGFAMLGYNRGVLTLNGGARLTDHDRFGSQWSLGGNASVDLGSLWRIKASFGEGFKAPTLYQLYGYGGNVALQAETSTALDLGIEFGDRGNSRGGVGHFAVTLFRRDSANLIDYVWPTGYFNVGRTRAQGVEVEASVRPGAGLAIGAAYTFLDATNRLTGKQLARRPRHALTVSADWDTSLAGLKLGADLRLVGDSFDDRGNFVPIDGHAVVTLRASLPVSEELELYARIENVTDTQYQTVAGYGTYGRSAYAGVRVKW
ncbi:MAG: TonB-dependent receptor plug domain-containing protein [Novosphingobium sp.]